MFGWFKDKEERGDRGKAAALYDAVRSSLGDQDDTHVRIVASVAAVLLCVAYADLQYAREEEEVLGRTLGRVQGLDSFGVEAILKVLREQTIIIASGEATTYARELLELTEDDFRLELLDVLVDLAAADETITVAETNMLRDVARALGLSQAHYNDSQARHRDKLSVLKG
jgi:uncharacterized tellurite resistance protein B-like protein